MAYLTKKPSGRTAVLTKCFGAGGQTLELPATSSTAAASGGAGFGLVDADAASHPLHILEVINGLGFVPGISQINESKTTLATCFAVKRQAALTHLTVLGEEVLKVLYFGIEGEVAYENSHELNSERIKPIR
jgi:hypothetical protein